MFREATILSDLSDRLVRESRKRHPRKGIIREAITAIEAGGQDAGRAIVADLLTKPTTPDLIRRAASHVAYLDHLNKRLGGER